MADVIPMPRPALVIAGERIRCDAAGRYCLNDLHRAAGGALKHQPSFWLRNAQTEDLVTELIQSADSQSAQPVQTINGGRDRGTYVVKELVYAYAMWISPAFHLRVIRAYDALMTAPPVDPMKLLNDPAALRLIVAAPQLLAGAERMLANIERWLETGIASEPDESRSIYEQLRSAVEAATGAAPRPLTKEEEAAEVHKR